MDNPTHHTKLAYEGSRPSGRIEPSVGPPLFSGPEFRTVFEVYTTTSMQGGQGKKIGTFTDFGLANAAAEGIGFYGSKGLVQPVRAIVIGKQAYILKHNDPIDLDEDDNAQREKLRQAALTKLTDAEKDVLGLKDGKDEDTKDSG